MDSDEKFAMYDNALLGILQDQGKILPFLDTIFGFLYRRTDFFRIQHGDSKVGFPPQVAENLVLSTLRKFEKLAEEDEKVQLTSGNDIPVNETTDTDASAKALSNVKNQSEDIDHSSEMCENIETKNVDTDDENDEQSEQLKKEQQVFQSLSDSYNGAVRENYSWSQSIHDLDIMVKVPKHIIKGKQVKVNIEHNHLAVKIIEDSETKPIVDGELCWKINLAKSFWTLIPGQAVQVNLEKVQERWWDGILTDEPKINIRNIDARRPMEELADDEQAKIHELMFNEQQKRLGKPTVEQMRIENILRDAWDTEGSPFKGQPFDLSKVNIASDGSAVISQDE